MKPLKVLYAVQGTGNGHVARAQALLPLLTAQPFTTVDVLLSGTFVDVALPVAPLFSYPGISFHYGKNGGINWFKTATQNNWLALFRDILRAPVAQYDLVINDFEPVSAYACKIRRVPIVDVSHQAGVRHPRAARPSWKDPVAEWVLAHFAPAPRCVGFHFQSFGNNYRTPVIRPAIRELNQAVDGSVLVYLPAFAPDVLEPVFSALPERTWHVFIRAGLVHPSSAKNVIWHTIDQEAFLDRLGRCSHVLCSAGFELPSEALFLGRQVAVIPIVGQFEQACNAQEAARLGVCVLGGLHRPEDLDQLKHWLKADPLAPVDFPDETEKVVRRLLSDFRSNPELPEYVRPK
jgi:uncharacterized protein (TIGR00661 family)